MIRLLFYAVIFYICYRLIKGPVAFFLKGRIKSEDSDESGLADAEMIKDPQCGAYFMKQKGVQARIGGKTFYFCSESCRDKFLKR
ncbi:MAG: YHS domain-containing protein [Deltaproteobacteria bacterium]|jgi:YHS domain-containing protein|nr:YHS domain-containing protein [Deltaproteobacteria bacterium]